MTITDILHRLNKFGLEFYQLFYSNYPAHVVDNEDPDGQGRLLVLLSTILGPESQPIWAYPKGQWAGDNCGIQLLPQIGDLVWVECQNGKMTSPIWSHYYHHAGQKPPEFKHPKVYGIKTPRGFVVTIDDTTDTVLITSPLGPAITIQGDMVGIKNSTNTVIIDGDGIAVNAGGNDIHVYNDSGSVSITDSGVEVSSDKSINVGGQFPVLYSTVPGATEIVDVKEIGVSKKVNVG